MEKLIVVFASQEARVRMLRLLRRGGYEAVGCSSGAEAVRTARRLSGGAVVSGYRLPDMTAGELAERLSGTAPVLAVSSPENLSLCEGKNLWKLPAPAPPEALYAAVEAVLSHRVRPTPPSRDAAAMEVIRRAKAYLMERDGLSEPEAHRLLQKRAMDAGMPMAEAACQALEETR